MNSTPAEQATARRSLERILSPRSVAIIGMSARQGSSGQETLRILRANAFPGAIHLVGRAAGEIDGLAVVDDIDKLPEGVDLAILVLPASGVGHAIEQCIERRFGGAAIFASGFAEAGEEGRVAQEKLARRVRGAGFPVIGPNTTGFANFVDGQLFSFIQSPAVMPRLSPGVTDAVAMVTQSGGIQNHLYSALKARGVGVSYAIATGNEMSLGLGDFVVHLAAQRCTRVISVYAEHVADPQRFLEGVRAARAAGKPVVMLHSGRSAKGRDAAQSHTGVLAGDYAVMRAMLLREGVYFVDTLDELLDVTELLARHPAAQPGGLGILTMSGAYCGIAQDFCEDLGVEVPELGTQARSKLGNSLPDYLKPDNPLDLGTAARGQPELLLFGLEALLAEPSIAAVLIAIPPFATGGMKLLDFVLEARSRSDKPVVLVLLSDSTPIPLDQIEKAMAHRLVMWRSPDRAVRAIARLLQHTPAAEDDAREPPMRGERLAPGVLAEWRSKELLKRLGVRVPEGELALDAGAAKEIARRIGYPVALKAQGAALPHKTEAGAVMLNVKDGAHLDDAWAAVHENLRRAGVHSPIDGVLVERMSAPGLELLVGAKRDPHWGAVILVGLGGILVEALRDVRILSANASKAEILRELRQLKAATLLDGFRNMPPVDTSAVADIVQKLGKFMHEHPEVVEVDLNPVMAHAEGATALDALVVTA